LAFEDIKRKQVTKLLDYIADHHGRRQADMVLGIIRKLMNWYTSRNDDYVSPVVRGMTRCVPSAHRRQRFLDNDEIQAVWQACAKAGTYGAIVKVLLLSGQRRDKVATMKWTDIVDGVWTIPSEAREKINAGKLRLPKLALDVINAQPRILDNPFVFVSSSGRTHFNSFSQRKAELDAKLPGLDEWHIHDLRRTSRKLMTRAKIRPDVAELALGHSIKGIQATYDDRSEYQPMIDLALQSVADEIERILNPLPPNVVAIR
jgi:integrase